MLYRYVGVRYVICNIIIDVSYKLLMDGTGGGKREMDVRGQGGWTLGERKLECLKLNILSDSCSAEYNEVDVYRYVDNIYNVYKRYMRHVAYVYVACYTTRWVTNVTRHVRHELRSPAPCNKLYTRLYAFGM